ncbi:MAG: flavin reductase [Acidimicrobiales bacterium]|nr:flavin reductase [Acidimicrobiales bacterium]
MAAFTDRVEYSFFVVTTASSPRDISGCLAGFVTQCSIRPPRFLICISKVNHTYFVAERAEGVVLHILGRDQTELASLFGGHTGDNFAKFQHCHWSPGTTGAPVLSDCAAWIECLILERFDVGDHQALLARPVAGDGGQCQGVLTSHTLPPLEPGHPVA